MTSPLCSHFLIQFSPFFSRWISPFFPKAPGTRPERHRATASSRCPTAPRRRRIASAARRGQEILEISMGYIWCILMGYIYIYMELYIIYGIYGKRSILLYIYINIIMIYMEYIMECIIYNGIGYWCNQPSFLYQNNKLWNTDLWGGEHIIVCVYIYTYGIYNGIYKIIRSWYFILCSYMGYIYIWDVYWKDRIHTYTYIYILEY